MTTREDAAGLALTLVSLADAQTAAKAWHEALTDALNHVLLVIGNNPSKPVRVVLLRPDVREALSEPFVSAGVETVMAIREAWDKAAGDVLIPKQDLTDLLKDARRNAASMPRVLASVIRSTDDPATRKIVLEKVMRDYIRRAEFGIAFAAERARNLRILASGKKGYKKQWWSPPHPTQCSFCAALHGKILPMDQDFPHIAGDRVLKPFKGRLLAPPAHPRCRCRIRLVKA